MENLISVEKPFNPNSPVSNPQYFWGRDSDLTKVLSRINAERPQSISIVGGHKIGKTSLINIINTREIQEKYLDNPNDYIFLKMKVDETVKNVSTFVRRFIDLINEHIGECEINDSESDEYTFIRKFITICSENGKKIIVLLDDFHHITSNQDFPLEFFAFLRSMANSYNIAYVTTSKLELQKLCVIKDVEESPFFNIFSNFVLKLFTEKQVKETVGEILNSTGINQTGQDYFWQNALHHPYVMSVIGSLLIEHDANEIEQLAMKHLQGFFSQLWEELKDLEREVLKTVIKGDLVPEQVSYVVRELGKRSLLVDENDCSIVFTPLFRKFVVDRYMQKGRWLGRLLYGANK